MVPMPSCYCNTWTELCTGWPWLLLLLYSTSSRTLASVHLDRSHGVTWPWWSSALYHRFGNCCLEIPSCLSLVFVFGMTAQLTWSLNIICDCLISLVEYSGIYIYYCNFSSLNPLGYHTSKLSFYTRTSITVLMLIRVLGVWLQLRICFLEDCLHLWTFSWEDRLCFQALF